jgi:hypothetical protein
MLPFVRWGKPPVFLIAVAAILATPVASLSQKLPKVTVRRVDLTEKLRTSRFDSLGAELSAYEMKAEKDPRYEMNAMVAFGAFDSPTP